jgi:hypothetical protein
MVSVIASMESIVRIVRNTVVPMIRRSNFQSVGWLYDLHERGLLNMDPPYQRRSIWNQEYKDFFVDTVLRGYPCPAIFLYEEVKPDGRSLFAVVDGKQRLSSLFEFVRGDFPVPNSIKNPAPEKPFDVFRFDTTRLYYRLRPRMGESEAGVEKYRLLFEVQIKSAFDHAWSTATHHLTYKSAQIDWRRLRLSAQIKAVVEQLDVTILGFELMAPLIAENPDRRLQIRRDVGELFTRAVAEKQIPEESLPKDFSRFVENFCDMIRAARLSPENAVSIARRIVGIIAERDPGQFPRSLSLFQFCFAEATSNSLIGRTRDSYSVPITPELESLYPHLRGHNRGFALE